MEKLLRTLFSAVRRKRPHAENALQAKEERLFHFRSALYICPFLRAVNSADAVFAAPLMKIERNVILGARRG